MKSLLHRLPFEFVEAPPRRFCATRSHEKVNREIAYPYLISSTIVTVGQWAKFAKLPNWLENKTERYPVEMLNLREALEFVDVLEKGLNLPAGYDISFPFESEWELACRAGTTTTWFFGDSPDLLPGYAWFNKNSGSRVHEVAQLRPNPLGLFDVYGNVNEWCFKDGVRLRFQEFSPQELVGSRDILARGGSCYGTAVECSSSAQEFVPWMNPMNDPLGIRLVIRPQGSAVGE